jgi:hypothetical protein
VKVGESIVLVDSCGLEVYRPAYPPQVMAESLDSSFIVPSSKSDVRQAGRSRERINSGVLSFDTVK